MTQASVIIGMITTALVVIGAWLLFLRQRSKNLRLHFGPEYEHAVWKYGSPQKAEDVLLDRRKRVEKFHVHSLSSGQRSRFAEQWLEAQKRFVDDPAGSIESADQLVGEVMCARGYPMSEFEGRAEDLSVDHPHVIRNYRAGHAIALRSGAGTEELRQALVFYRDLFDELLEAPVAERTNPK